MALLIGRSVAHGHLTGLGHRGSRAATVTERPAREPAPFAVVDAEPADVETLYGIYRDVVAAGGAAPETGAGEREAFLDGWVRRRRVYAARRDGVTVGGYFLRSSFPAMAGHIAQAGYLVARSERGGGIGTRLLAHSLEEAERHGYRAMVFSLVQESNPSRRLYERAGFRVVGRIPEVHGEEAGLIYWRRLGGSRPTDD